MTLVVMPVWQPDDNEQGLIQSFCMPTRCIAVWVHNWLMMDQAAFAAVAAWKWVRLGDEIITCACLDCLEGFLDQVAR